MPSFDVVSRLDMQEIDNAVSNAMKEITQRYDFKGSISKLERSDNVVTLLTEDDMKAKQVIEILTSHLIKRKIDPKAVKLKSSENASGNTIRQRYDLLEGIDQEMGKKITKMIKDTKLERIAKSIASTGYCSRRQAEKLILMGEVKVNGSKILTPAFFVSKNDKITIKNIMLKSSTKTKLFVWSLFLSLKYA